MANDNVDSNNFNLTDEQVENWRTILVAMPLPPTMLPLGPFALIMSREMVVTVAERVQKMLDEAIETERLAQNHIDFGMFSIPKPVNPPRPANITRTRPRDPKKPVRR
jgi:hypothetical protein